MTKIGLSNIKLSFLITKKLNNFLILKQKTIKAKLNVNKKILI